MGQIGKQRVLAFYDIRDVMNQYLDLYEMHLYSGATERENAARA